MRVMMVITSVAAYAINQALARAKYRNADEMDFEKPLTCAGLAHVDSFRSA